MGRPGPENVPVLAGSEMPPRGVDRLRTRKTWISLFIVAVMVAHVAPIFQEMRSRRQTFWPIMAWGMYRYSHRPPVKTTSWQIIAETSNGEEEPVGPLKAGLGPHAFSELYIQPMSRGDSTAAQRLGEILNRDRPVRISRLVVRGVTHRVTDEGVVVAPEPSVTYPVGE